MLKQTSQKLFSLPKNQIKKKEKKNLEEEEEGRRVTGHVLRHLEKRRGCVETEKNPVEFRRGRGWLARRVGTYPLVKMDGLSPYKSNGIFDRGRVSAGRGSMVGLQGAGVEGWRGGGWGSPSRWRL